MAAINNMIRKYGALDEIFGQEQYAQIPMAVVGIVMKFFQIVISIVVGMAAGCIPVVGYNIIVELFPGALIGIFGAANESAYYTAFAIKAYDLENLLGSPLSFKLACRVFNPQKNHPMIFETAIICATVAIMCPAMSFLAAWFYYPYYAGFNIWTLLANWLKLVCFNFPFAYFTQLFFIQPAVRVIFKTVFRKDIEARAKESEESMAQKGKKPLPDDETDTVADTSTSATKMPRR